MPNRIINGGPEKMNLERAIGLAVGVFVILILVFVLLRVAGNI